MDQKTILHILRNPSGWSEAEIREARLVGADEIERLGSARVVLNPNDGGELANAVGRYIDGGCNDEDGLREALSQWAQGGASQVLCPPDLWGQARAALMLTHERLMEDDEDDAAEELAALIERIDAAIPTPPLPGSAPKILDLRHRPCPCCGRIHGPGLAAPIEESKDKNL